MQDQARGGLIPRLCLNSFSPIMHGTIEPEKCKAVLDLSRKTFSAIPPRAKRSVIPNNDAADTSIAFKHLLVPSSQKIYDKSTIAYALVAQSSWLDLTNANRSFCMQQTSGGASQTSRRRAPPSCWKPETG